MSEENTTAPESAVPEEVIVETEHTIVVGGETIAYKVTTGTMLIKEEDEKKGHYAKASMFFVAYTRVDVEGNRPITFSFNGGPGSSSVWMHLGVLGPKRVLMDDVGNPLPPPYKLVDNEFTLLGVSDLVFIDPISTGYSRAVPGEKANQFHNFKQDVASVGEFIRLFCTRYGRWSSPKYLIGESYGTTRGAALAGHLQDKAGIFLNGVMLISSILNFQTAVAHVGNDLPYVLFLPTYAATAWYHKQLGRDMPSSLRELLEEVEEFAIGRYASALMRGNKLDFLERTEVVNKLASYTGLSERYIEETNLRINIHRFVKELLRDERMTIGRLDSRFTGIDRDAAGEYHSHDPSLTNILGCYTACLNDYVRNELNFESDLPYEILTANVRPWKWEPFENAYVNVAETLRDAISKNPHLKVFIANGYYDLATPYFATDYTINHLGLEPELEGNVQMAYYEAGHMMYIHKPSLQKLKADLVSFVTST